MSHTQSHLHPENSRNIGDNFISNLPACIGYEPHHHLILAVALLTDESVKHHAAMVGPIIVIDMEDSGVITGDEDPTTFYGRIASAVSHLDDLIHNFNDYHNIQHTHALIGTFVHDRLNADTCATLFSRALTDTDALWYDNTTLSPSALWHVNTIANGTPYTYILDDEQIMRYADISDIGAEYLIPESEKSGVITQYGATVLEAKNAINGVPHYSSKGAFIDQFIGDDTTAYVAPMTPHYDNSQSVINQHNNIVEFFGELTSEELAQVSTTHPEQLARCVGFYSDIHTRDLIIATMNEMDVHTYLNIAPHVAQACYNNVAAWSNMCAVISIAYTVNNAPQLASLLLDAICTRHTEDGTSHSLSALLLGAHSNGVDVAEMLDDVFFSYSDEFKAHMDEHIIT